MEYIEVTGKSVDEAITNACLKLETSSDNIEYEVIREKDGYFDVNVKNRAALK